MSMPGLATPEGLKVCSIRMGQEYSTPAGSQKSRITGCYKPWTSPRSSLFGMLFFVVNQHTCWFQPEWAAGAAISGSPLMIFAVALCAMKNRTTRPTSLF